MKFSCSKESLTKLLNIADNIISTKTSISILSNVLIEALDNKIKITSTETKINFFGYMGADIFEKGSVTVNCNKFFSIIKKLPSEEIEITSDSTNLINIKPKNKENIRYTIKGIESDKFPAVKEPEEEKFLSIRQEILYDMIKRTIFSVSETDNRRFISGVYFEIKDSFIKMVATDGKRLSLVKTKIEDDIKLDNGIIIPPKILNEVSKLCSDNGDAQISLREKEIYIKINNYSFLSNLLEGNFPPYEKVIPFDQSISIKVNKKELYDSIDRINQIADKESHKITISLKENNMILFTEDISIGYGEEILPIENYNKKDEFKISLNSNYLSDVLSVIKSENVILEFKDPRTTISVKEENNDNFIYIMMPMT